MSETMDTTDITVTDEAGIRHVRLTRPAKRNALTRAMYEQLAAALREADADASIGAVLISGEGHAFCAGNDLVDFLANPPKGEDSAVFRFLMSLIEVRVPIVAAVHGQAVGIGATMLLHCDFAVADETAVLSYPFVPLGLVPEAGSSLLLPQIAGSKLAARLLYLGEPIGAREALEAGLVTSVVAPGEQLDAARHLAGKVAALPRDAVRSTRALIRGPEETTVERIRREAAVFVERLGSPEFAEQAQRFLGR